MTPKFLTGAALLFALLAPSANAQVATATTTDTTYGYTNRTFDGGYSGPYAQRLTNGQIYVVPASPYNQGALDSNANVNPVQQAQIGPLPQARANCVNKVAGDSIQVFTGKGPVIATCRLYRNGLFAIPDHFSGR